MVILYKENSMNNRYISLTTTLLHLWITFLCTESSQASSNILSGIQNMQTSIHSLQNNALKSNFSGQEILQDIQALQNEYAQLKSNNLLNDNYNQNNSNPIQLKKPNESNKVSDKEVKKAHEGTVTQQGAPEEKNKLLVKTQSMENGKDDFSESDQATSTLHQADQSLSKDANIDADTKSHQSFFLGEGMVTVQALPESVDAFDAKSKKNKLIGSYTRSLNYVQGYSLGTLKTGSKTIVVLEDNAATKTPIIAAIQKEISKKPAAYIKNPRYNKLVQKSPIIINLYEYKA